MNRIKRHFFNMTYPFGPITIILRHRELLLQLLVRDIESKYRGTYLGALWIIVQPILMLCLYTFVFGFVFNGRFKDEGVETTLQYAMGIYLGLNLFQFLSEVLSVSPSIIQQNRNLVKKVVFPLEILPIVTVGSSSVYFFVSQGLAIFASFFIGEMSLVGVLWVLIIYLPFVLLCLGVSWLVSAVGVFVTDTVSFMRFSVMSLMFASAIFYPAKDIPSEAWIILKFNPLIHVIEMSRSIILWDEKIGYGQLAYLYVSSIIIFYFGYVFYRKLAKHYADVL